MSEYCYCAMIVAHPTMPRAPSSSLAHFLLRIRESMAWIPYLAIFELLQFGSVVEKQTFSHSKTKSHCTNGIGTKTFKYCSLLCGNLISKVLEFTDGVSNANSVFALGSWACDVCTKMIPFEVKIKSFKSTQTDSSFRNENQAPLF